MGDCVISDRLERTAVRRMMFFMIPGNLKRVYSRKSQLVVEKLFLTV